jgi:hypothetical protein
VGRLLALALGTLACLAAATGAAARPAGGWETHTRADAGFSLATPAAWVDVTGSAGKILGQMAKSSTLASLAQIARGNDLIKFLCADPSGDPNVNVIELVTGPVGLRTLVAQNVDQIRRLPFVKGRVSVATVKLPAGPTELVTYTEAPQGTSVETLQYFLVHRGRAYVLTYTTGPAPDPTTRATISRSARSFRYLESALVS